ncbi:hypothetical protein MKW94_007058 [Papaver nudicaule]|uniref:Uncharacterized protein n=1 Tax=Papaver nudicaule TaxID=74823 RepID=A0AA41V028_PAPNU|nr:hypothetical protein [Papaver nudicaule]
MLPPPPPITGSQSAPWTMHRTENSSVYNAVYMNTGYHPVQKTDPPPRNAQDGLNTPLNALASSTMGVANGTRDYSGYASKQIHHQCVSTHDSQISVGIIYHHPLAPRHGVPKSRKEASNKVKFNNVFVQNLSDSTTDDELKKVIGEYGTITSAVVMRDADGKSKCFGFTLNDKKIEDKEWFVGKAQKNNERENELKEKFNTMKETVDKFQGVNLYVKNLDDSVDDDKLRELFAMRDPNGISRGSGFVAFSTPEESSRALTEMNGKMIAFTLQAQFSQMRPVAIAPSVAPCMPMYPPGGPGLGQQIFYGQPGFGYQLQLVLGMMPGGGGMPNFFVPMVQQGQRPGGRHGSGPVQQPQQPMPLMPQQMLPRGGRMYRYPPGRNMAEGPMPGVAGGMLLVQYDMDGNPMRDVGSQPIPVGALATALANASPDQQRTMLGENLYPLVDQLEHEMTAKVTEMLLEMDQTEVCTFWNLLKHSKQK